MFKSLTDKKIYENSNLGFTFEFFSPLKKNELAAKIARNLGKRVKWFKDINESFHPTYEIFKLTPKYDSGFDMVELTTSMIPYQEAVHLMFKAMNIINEVGYTTDRCSLKVKIGLNEEEVQIPFSISKINKLKYLLSLNEKEIFTLWPENSSERQKVYQNRLSFIHPKNLFTTVLTPQVIERLDSVELNFPESEFFGNDFSDIGKGWLNVSYIGGKNYQNKKKEAVEAINIVIKNLYKTLATNYEYSVEEKRKISDLVREYLDVLESVSTVDKLRARYPEILLTVDLKNTPFLIESHYPSFRQDLFKLIAYGGLVSGQINFDLDRKKLQIKDSDIKKGVLIEKLEFFNCKIEADANECLFQGCIIKNSKLNECVLFSNNFIKHSKIIECNYQGPNEISSSYLENSEDKMIKAEIRLSLIKKGTFSIDSKIDESTKIITRS